MSDLRIAKELLRAHRGCGFCKKYPRELEDLLVEKGRLLERLDQAADRTAALAMRMAEIDSATSDLVQQMLAAVTR